MKKKLPILLLIITIVVSLILLVPSQIYANGVLPSEDPTDDLVITVYKGSASSPTEIEVCATNAPEGEWYYEFYVVKYPGTIDEFNYESNPESFIVYEDDGYFTIYYEGDVDCDSFEVQLGDGHYFVFVFVYGEDERTIETTGAGVGYIQFIPSNSLSSKAQNNDQMGELEAWNYKEFTIGEAKAAAEPEPWVRGDRDMVCYQVWVNENNCFELVFWWEYEMNNWVRIYKMNEDGTAGEMVYEVDMPYQDAHIEVCLPDGMYLVKTYHDQPESLQEFIIGKPVPEAEM